MIKLTRGPKKDKALKLDLLKSKVLRRLFNQFDSFVVHDGDPQEVMFVDLHGRWFVGFTDLEDTFFTSGNNPDYTGPEALPTIILRSVYVMPFFRGRGLQKQILEHIVGLAEEFGESIGSFADPFEIITKTKAEPFVPLLAIIDLATNGYRPLNDYYVLEKQRKAFLSAGFKNCMCLESTTTNPRQHFLYVPSTADDDAKQMQQVLELDHRADYELFQDIDRFLQS